eukprot:403339320
MMKSATTNYNKIKLLIILATLCNLILTQDDFNDQPISRSLVAQSTQLFVPCSQDSDCNPPFIFCSNETKLCEHKPIFPIYQKELVGIVIIPLLLSLFSIAGLGGGGIIIPFSMIFFVFDTKNAIAISNFAIFTCSVTRYIYTLDKKHPHPDKKQNVIIEYNLAIVMLPTVMMGSLTGVFLNIIFPAIALQAILTALLIFLSLQSLMKGKDMYRKETIKFQQEAEKLKKKQDEERLMMEKILKLKTDSQGEIIRESPIDEEQLKKEGTKPQQIQNFEIEEGQPLTKGLINNVNQEELQQLERILEKEKGHKQWDKHLTCLLIFSLLVSTNLLRGNKSLDSIIGIERCSLLDWMVLFTFYILCSSITFLGIRRVRKEQILKEKYKRGLADCDIRLTPRNTLRLQIFSFVGGWISGALGLGGGAIFNPILIGLGTPPAVATATSMYMISFSSAGSTATYIIYGLINLPFSIWVGVIGCFGATGGLALFNVVTKKYNRQSFIVFVLAGVMGASALLVPIFGGLDLMKLIDRGEDIFKMNSICK